MSREEIVEQILAQTSSVYFLANQLRLLELANLDVSPSQNMLKNLESWAASAANISPGLPLPRRSYVPGPAREEGPAEGGKDEVAAQAVRHDDEFLVEERAGYTFSPTIGGHIRGLENKMATAP